MAQSLDIAQSANQTNTNTFNKKSIAKIVGIVFHSDLYTGRCKLYPIDNAAASKRLHDMADRPEDWCRPELMRCCDDHDNPCYFTSAITQDPDKPNRWVCFVLDPYLPLGRYMLEVHRKKGRPIYHQIKIKGKMYARDFESERALDGSEGNPVELMTDFLVGDGVSLEESLFNLCSYRYEDSIGRMREKDMDAVGAGEEPESGFKTAIGIAHSMQEMIAHSLGIVKIDFPMYKNLLKLEKFVAGDKGRFTKQILFLWRKSGLMSATLNFAINSKKPVTDGLLAWTEDHKKLKRLSGLGIIEERYLKPYRKAVDEYEVGGKISIEKISDGIEVIGAGFAILDNLLSSYDMVAAFDDAWAAWERMGEELGTTARQMSEVPVEGQPWTNHGGGWFSRGDLTALENLKMLADNAQAKAQEAGWAWFMKVLPTALGFCEFGELMKDCKKLEQAQKGYAAAQFVATKADSLLHSNVQSVYTAQIANKFHDLSACAGNDNALMNHAVGMSLAYWHMQSVELQFYVRAKVLYGLKRLIDSCGPLGNKQRRISKYNFIQSWLAPGKTFDQAVDELRVGPYIKELCLADCFWVRKDHLLVDWIHHWMEEKDPAHAHEIIRTTDPNDTSKWFKVEFQRYWPIHHADITAPHKFAERFATDWSSVDDSDVETCFLQRGKAQIDSKTGNILIRTWERLDDKGTIDSETPVRAILVFKKDAAVRPGLPVQFQVERTDWLNVPGPLYRTVVRPIAPPMCVEKGTLQNDTYLKKYADQLGAIVDFSYSYAWKKSDGSEEPAKVYYGLKPMIENADWKEVLKEFGFTKIWALARNAKQKILPSTMDFAIKYVVGEGEAEGYVKTKGRFWDSTSEVTVQLKHCTGPKDDLFDERNRAKFGDLEFLRRQLPESPPPKEPLPKIKKVVAQYFRDNEWKPVTGEGISVADPVRVVFVFDKKVLRVPVTALIKRTDGALNIGGPHYTSNVVSQLDNLGHEFKGKWGVVITPGYYLMKWVKAPYMSAAMSVSIMNGGELWRGIKPITREQVCTTGAGASDNTWSGYKFSIYYGVGTDDPNQAGDVVSIPGSVMNDVPLTVNQEVGPDNLPLYGVGVYGISTYDRYLYRGITVSACTMPFVAQIYKDDGNAERIFFGNDLHKYFDAIEEMAESAQPAEASIMYEMINAGTPAY